MALSNHDRVGSALETLGGALGTYVDRRMARLSPMGKNWRSSYKGENVETDPSTQIGVILDNWQVVFRDELRSTGRNLVGEVRDWRNKWAHNEPFSHDDAYRSLDTIERLLTAIDAVEASTVGTVKSDLMRQRVESEGRKATPKPDALFTEPAAGLRPWREVVLPHDDVARGKFALAEFAANLYQVHLRKGLAEYTDPLEFFQRTYLTVGLRQLLTQGAHRITGGDGGAPVVNLQTNFGGGKTHSMIALYHLFSGMPVTGFPQEVQELLEAAAVKHLPAVRRAVLVGTQLSPGQSEVKPDGTDVRTVWGEMAWQLGGAEGYQLVAEADRTATNPGQAIEEVLRRFGPCLILIDEWVAYARQLFETREERLPGGTFETQFSFAQTLAEAAIAVPGALLVVSLPVSDDPTRPGVTPIGSEAEVGGYAGQETARRLGNVIGRTETSWRPASAEESFEIVRRRLFESISADRIKDRDATARSFGEFYRREAAEFPGECRDQAYVEMIKRAYPIHPELFARLYEDWSTLEGFQRTRGVLRLMAAVISALWAGSDQSPLILPASIPLDDAAVQAELTRNLDSAWLPILDTDIDGPASVPRKVDAAFPNLGRYGAARRAARAVFLASAPRSGANQGVEIQRIKLACTLPGESVATYGDALNRLTDRSSYLYVEGARYWYGTQASVARRARDLVEQLLATRRDEVHAEIIGRLRKQTGERGEFAAVHVCPANAGEVPDDPEARMVVLPPAAPHSNRDDSSQAMAAARGIFDQRGSGQRLYRNMLVFLAPDLKRLDELERGAAEYLAWSDIEDRRAELNLDVSQTNTAHSKRDDAHRSVDLRIAETYCWTLVPDQPDPTGAIVWETIKADGQGGLAMRASRKLVNSGSLGIAYAGELLRGLLSDGGVLASMWFDGHTTINALWDAFARYPYLPRLKSLETLCGTVQQGANPITWELTGFAIADAYDAQTNHYVGLTTDGLSATVTGQSLVVRPDVTRRQLDEEAARLGEAANFDSPVREPVVVASGKSATTPVDETLRRFYAVAKLDPERYQRDFSKLAAEVIANLVGQIGTEVEVTVEVKATNSDGFPDHLTRTVNENARTLKLDSYGFESE